MRNISFALTTEQVLAQTKTVTRRLGWAHLTAGTLLQPVVKGQGLKKGEKVQKIGGPIRVKYVTREPLQRISTYPHVPTELASEGFPEMTPADFVTMFCQANPGCTGETIVTRIQFEYVDKCEDMVDALKYAFTSSSERGHRPAPPSVQEGEREATPGEMVLVEDLTRQIRAACDGKPTPLILTALQEMYARVVSACINDPDEMEKALVMLTKNVRGWWCADRGGSFREN